MRAQLLLQTYLLYGPLFIGIPITIVLLIHSTPHLHAPLRPTPPAKMDSINEWMTFRRISNRLRLKIRKFVHNRRQALVLLNERKLLENLSVPLRISVLFKIHEEMIEKVRGRPRWGGRGVKGAVKE